jgi:Putative zinc-finger
LVESFVVFGYRMRVIEISCVEVWKEISSFIDDEVEPELRARMEAHFKVCAHCTAILDGTRNVVKLVADGVEYRMPEGFSRRLYDKIRDK